MLSKDRFNKTKTTLPIFTQFLKIPHCLEKCKKDGRAFGAPFGKVNENPIQGSIRPGPTTFKSSIVEGLESQKEPTGTIFNTG